MWRIDGRVNHDFVGIFALWDFLGGVLGVLMGAVFVGEKGTRWETRRVMSEGTATREGRWLQAASRMGGMQESTSIFGIP